LREVAQTENADRWRCRLAFTKAKPANQKRAIGTRGIESTGKKKKGKLSPREKVARLKD